MENPTTWTVATNVIHKALLDWHYEKAKVLSGTGGTVIGGSLAAYIETKLGEAGCLTSFSQRIEGYQHTGSKVDNGE